MEVWRAGGSNTGASAEEARGVEDEGWHGQMFMDSQSLSADPWAQMGAWAAWTSRLALCPGVTNPFTRNLVVTAAAAATIQAISGGRAVLGIGRGDSALAWLGYAPVGLTRFDAALSALQRLLSGKDIAFEESGTQGNARSYHELKLGARPENIALRWLSPDLPKVPLDVAATGPKVIAMAVRHAERVTFSVGAEPERVHWALDTAEQARKAAGLPAESRSYGAQLVVVCHPSMDEAMEVAMHMAPPLARFQVMEGKAVGPHDKEAAGNFSALAGGYDMTRHGDIHSHDRIVGGGRLSPEFIRRFAIVGPPETCFLRISELAKAGLKRFVIVGPGFYPAHWGDVAGLFAREVLPGLATL